MKQTFFSQDDFYLLRQHIKEVYDQASDYIKNCNHKLSILEVGPCRKSHFPELNVDWIEKNSKDIGHDYKTFDICGDVDYVGTIEKCVFENESYDVVILLSVLEHVEDIFSAVKEISRITKSGGKVFLQTPFMFKIHGPIPDYWRLSEYAYTSLFSKNFDIELDTYPKNSFGKNSYPLSYNAILTKK